MLYGHTASHCIAAYVLYLLLVVLRFIYDRLQLGRVFILIDQAAFLSFATATGSTGSQFEAVLSTRLRMVFQMLNKMTY